MTITEFFNPHNVDHMVAYDHVMATGRWPEGFIPEGTVFSSVWQVELLGKMAYAWIEAVRNGHVFGMPAIDQ
jgi:hypothetical protein